MGRRLKCTSGSAFWRSIREAAGLFVEHTESLTIVEPIRKALPVMVPTSGCRRCLSVWMMLSSTLEFRLCANARSFAGRSCITNPVNLPGTWNIQSTRLQSRLIFRTPRFARFLRVWRMRDLLTSVSMSPTALGFERGRGIAKRDRLVNRFRCYASSKTHGDVFTESECELRTPTMRGARPVYYSRLPWKTFCPLRIPRH